MPNEIANSTRSRREVLVGAGLAAALALLPVPAPAATTAEADALVSSVVAAVLGVINSGKAEPAMLRDFEQIFQRYADVPVIARSALGTPWRSASASQQQHFVAAFSGYMSRKYGKQFRSFEGAVVEITRTRDAGRKGILVETQAKLKGQAPFAVEWQVSDGGGSLKLINLNIEGIWLLTTEREEIGAMLEARGGDLNRLIADLPGLG